MKIYNFFYKAEYSTLNIIGLKEGQYTATIYDISGKKIMETNFTSNQNNELLIPSLTEKLYLLRISDGTNSTTKKMLLK